MTTATTPQPMPALETPHVRKTLSTRLADVVSEIFAPLVQVLLQSGLVLGRTGLGSTAVGWWLLSALFGSALPMLFLLLGVRRGSWLNHHIPRREQRLTPMLVILLSFLLGLAVLTLAGAPHVITGLFLSLAAQLTVLAVITCCWKISVHTAVVTMTVVVAAATYGSGALVLAPLCPLTMWARTHLRAHTLLQTVVGVLVGGSVAWVTVPHLQ